MSITKGRISTSANPLGVDFEWRIDDFLSVSEMICGTIYSPAFYFDGHIWFLHIFPNGCSDRDSCGYVDLDLFRYSSGPSSLQECSVSLKTSNGKQYKVHGAEVYEGWNNHEFNRFVPKSELLIRCSELLPYDALTVVCTMNWRTSTECASNSTRTKCCYCKGPFNAECISIHQKRCMQRPIKCPGCFEVVILQKWLDDHECQKEKTEEDLKELLIAELKKWDTPKVAGSDKAKACGSNQTGVTETKKSVSPVNLPGEYDWVISNFLKEGKSVDVSFETLSGKRKFIAHRLIMPLRSPYFADEFYGTESNNGHLTITLKEIEPKAFKQIISYCCHYNPCLRKTEDACALFKIAFELKVLKLQKLCLTFIRDNKIEARNVFSVLEVSEQMEDKSLGDMCNKFLQDKTRDVMAAYELCNVTPVMVHTFLNLSNLSLNSEFELIKWMFDWAKVKSEDEDSSSKAAREYLKRWLKDMNFLALTIEEFAILCKDNPEFFSSDEMASIYQNITCPGTREMPAWYDNNVKNRVYTGSKK